MRSSHVALVALYLVVMLVPAANLSSRFWKDATLEGAVEAVPKPTWSVRSFVEENFQREATASFEAEYGVKGELVRLDNSLTYYVFGETKRESSVRVGRANTLYEKDDVWYFNRPEGHTPEEVREFVGTLKRAQDALARRGKVFVFVISPSKTSFFPDEVPDGWRRPNLPTPRPADVGIYEPIMAELRRAGVNFVDSRALLLGAGFQNFEDVFTRPGRHWTHAAACRTMEAAFDIVRPRHSPERALPPLDCTYVPVFDTPVGEEEYDLWRLLNVWREKEPRYRAPHVKAVPERVPPARRIPAAFVGTSFSWKLIQNAERNHALGSIHAYYYNQELFDRGDLNLPPVPMDPRSARWREVTLSKELFVLETTEVYLIAKFIVDFSNQIVAALDADGPGARP